MGNSMSSEMIPVPDTVKSESPAPVAVETDKSAAQEQVTPNAEQAAGTEQPTPEKEEPTPGELKRKERNRERWQKFNEERKWALSEVQRLREENQRLKAPSADYDTIVDPDERLATMSADKVRQSFAGDIEAKTKQAQAVADNAVVSAWEAIKEDAREQMPDFDAVVTESTPIHVRAAPFIVESDKAAEIAYYLGKNVREAQDLYREFETNPARALIKLGKIEASVSKPSPKAHSSAPKPAPVLSGSSSPPAFDPGKSGVSDMQAMLKKAGILR